MRKLKICMLTADFLPNVGGITTHIYELSQALKNIGHEVIILHHSFSNKNAIREKYYEGLKTVESLTKRNKPISYIKDILQTRKYLKKLILEKGLDITHLHTLDYFGATTKFLKNTSLIFTNHSGGYLESFENFVERQYLKLSFGHFDQIIAPSRELCDKSRILAKKRRIHYVPNGVNTEKFRPFKVKKEFYEKYSLQDEGRIILCPRRLEPVKGVEYFVKAIPKILRTEDCSFLIVGGGFPEEKRRFVEFLKRKKVIQHVIFTGNVENVWMPNFYNVSLFSIFPSILEATSIAALESMSCAVPVIGTRVGGLPEIIQPKINGFLVEPRNSDEIAEKSLTMLRDENLRKTLGSNARFLVEEKFSWEKIAAETQNIYSPETS